LIVLPWWAHDGPRVESRSFFVEGTFVFAGRAYPLSGSVAE